MSADGHMRILQPEDDDWLESYLRVPVGKRDVFYSPGFAKACAIGLYPAAKVLCAIQQNNENIILYPFVERELAQMVPWSATAQSLRDTTGLYGRGGILCNGCSEQDLKTFRSQLAEYFRERHVVSSFDRYHPVLQNEDAAEPNTQVRDIGSFVVVPIAADMATIKANYRGKQRTTLRKAERAGVTVEFEKGCSSHLSEFLEIHAATMHRNSAEGFYFFPKSFYESLIENQPCNVLFAYGLLDNEIVTSDLVLVEPPYAHLFLSGTLPAYLDKSPNTKLKHETIRYLQQSGCDYYLLGGGHRPDDGVFRYKRSFAPNGGVPSLIGCTVRLTEQYEELHREFVKRKGPGLSDRFQFYEDCQATH